MKMKCNFCSGKCIKNGFQSNGNQRYKCCVCQKRAGEKQLKNYKAAFEKAYPETIWITVLDRY